MRPALVFVHGIGGARDPRAECAAWLAALAVGARKADHSGEAAPPSLDRLAEPAFAYYGDLLAARRPQGVAGTDPADAEELRNLLDELIEVRLELGPDPRERRILEHARAELRPPGRTQSPGELLRRIVNVCTTLLALPGLRRAGQWAGGRLMAGHLAQLTRYLARAEHDAAGIPLDRRIRERVLDRLDATRPAVVVAHSLGSVVAMEALQHHRGPVPLFVTLGSPIGMRAVVRPRLLPQPPAVPGCVERWLNFWDGDDIVVPRPRLEDDVLPNAHGCLPVTDRIDSDGLWTHTATKYLAQASVAGPVMAAVRAAGGPEGA
ncbi:alpha/beta hydrolase [Streptomyces sp. NPDC046915]|uniref:alpha/beta hydrolase n=1 Tax=Streptomyces sp. NPDC046915 TaxID=3155257 RepID=UPI0033D02A52